MSQERQDWMGLLARAPVDRISDLWAALHISPECTWLRSPEIGGVMVRGRLGGTGAPFNLGEMTVTRCTVRLQNSGTVGHAVVQGRDKTKARLAALIDALMQTDLSDRIRSALIAPLEAEETRQKTDRAGKAAATRVDFFTMVRGEDA